MKNLLIIILVGLSVTACLPPAETTVELMLAQTWKVSEVRINGVQDASTDYSAYRYTFDDDETYVFETSNGQTTEGTWELNATETKIILNQGFSDEEEIAIIEITEDKLELEFIIPKTFKDPAKTQLVKLLPF